MIPPVRPENYEVVGFAAQALADTRSVSRRHQRVVQIVLADDR